MLEEYEETLENLNNAIDYWLNYKVEHPEDWETANNNLSELYEKKEYIESIKETKTEKPVQMLGASLQAQAIPYQQIGVSTVLNIGLLLAILLALLLKD